MVHRPQTSGARLASQRCLLLKKSEIQSRLPALLEHPPPPPPSLRAECRVAVLPSCAHMHIGPVSCVLGNLIPIPTHNFGPHRLACPPLDGGVMGC